MSNDSDKKPYYQPKAHAEAAKQVKERKQVVSTWSSVLGIGKKKSLRRVDKEVDDAS